MAIYSPTHLTVRRQGRPWMPRMPLVQRPCCRALTIFVDSETRHNIGSSEQVIADASCSTPKLIKPVLPFKASRRLFNPHPHPHPHRDWLRSRVYGVDRNQDPFMMYEWVKLTVLHYISLPNRFWVPYRPALESATIHYAARWTAKNSYAVR